MARLRRTDCPGPGITRRCRGRGLSYTPPDGKVLTNRGDAHPNSWSGRATAWFEVWICPWSNRRIQPSAPTQPVAGSIATTISGKWIGIERSSIAQWILPWRCLGFGHRWSVTCPETGCGVYGCWRPSSVCSTSDCSASVARIRGRARDLGGRPSQRPRQHRRRSDGFRLQGQRLDRPSGVEVRDDSARRSDLRIRPATTPR